MQILQEKTRIDKINEKKEGQKSEIAGKRKVRTALERERESKENIKRGRKNEKYRSRVLPHV